MRPQNPPQVSKPEPPPETVLDYYDGLRAYLDEPGIAAGIWLEASVHGDRRAMHRLAKLYEEGQYLPQDFDLAYFWFAVANRLGDKTAGQDAERVSRRLSDPHLPSSRRQFPIGNRSA